MKLTKWSIALLLLFKPLLSTNIAPARSAFDEMLIVQPSAIIQLQYPYQNIPTTINGATNTSSPYYNIYTTGAGSSVSSSINFATLTASTTNSSATLMSKARLHYQPGQGCSTMFTAMFTVAAPGAAPAGSQQIGVGSLTDAGAPNIQDGFFFGYFTGQSYSYSYNGTSYVYTNNQTGPNYDGRTFGIIHVRNQLTYFYPQSAWNVDTFSGSGLNPSGIILSPTTGNVYKIQYQWLGFGIINFFIENPTTGVITLVHSIQYANSNTQTTLSNPSLQLMAQVKTEAPFSGTITLQNPSFVGFVEGIVNTAHDERNSIYSSATAYALPSAIGTYNHVLSIQAQSFFNNGTIVNQTQVFPDWISLLNITSNTEVIVKFILNPTLSTSLTYESINTILGTNTSTVNFASAGTGTGTGYGQVATVTGGITLLTMYMRDNTTYSFSISDYGLQLEPGDTLVIAASKLTNNAPNIFASISWFEGIA